MLCDVTDLSFSFSPLALPSSFLLPREDFLFPASFAVQISCLLRLWFRFCIVSVARELFSGPVNVLAALIFFARYLLLASSVPGNTSRSRLSVPLGVSDPAPLCPVHRSRDFLFILASVFTCLGFVRRRAPICFSAREPKAHPGYR
jgi:hypothetical protein